MRGLKNKKAVAWIVMLVFLFTCVMSSGTALAAANDQQIEYKGGESSNSDVTISKVITGTDKENYFDITLTVKTSETIEELALTQKTDVVIVMDISNTMNTNSRIGNAKTAAKQFVTDFTTAMGSSGRIGVVTFNRDAKKVQDFTSNATTLT
ncbi:MAG: VWA domain-containing protein, partial [Peptococcaceae bacterium]|nr:VWA domain-containing protein [Peptococcaceae bacterium]